MKLTDVLSHLKTTVETDLLHQLIDETHPWHGAYISPESRLADPSHGASSRFITSGGFLLWANLKHPDACPEIDADMLLGRVTLAADYMLTAQRPSGLIDLHSTNYDSSPDTGFVMQLFCALLDLTRNEPYFTALNGKLETFLRRATPGVRDGGFHTPNHRWVISSALAQVKRLFPDLEVQPALDLYLNEGFDIDDDGAYIERSIGVYDTVTDNALMLYAVNGERDDKKQEALAAVQKNLTFDLHLIHADGTAETGLSNRQDHGVRRMATNLIAPYVFASFLLGDESFLAAAEWLWQKIDHDKPESLHWLAYVLLKFGEPAEVVAQMPDNFEAFYPANQVWRAKHGPLSTTVYGGGTHLMNLCYGTAEIRSVRAAQTYFGTGLFVGDEIAPTSNSVVLRSYGKQKPRRPGYELPLGKPVDRYTWDARAEARNYRPLPSPESSLSIRVLRGALQLNYQTSDGLDGVAAQLSFDVPAGAVWETESGLLHLIAGQAVMYKQGAARLVFGNDVIEFSSGHYEQGYLQMRHTEAVPQDCARIILSFLTPVDFSLELRLYQGLSRGNSVFVQPSDYGKAVKNG